jgi:hypothetical protein
MRSLALVAAVCSLWGGVCFAGNGAPDTSALRLHGFGTAGVAYVDAPEGWAFTRNLNQANNDNSFRSDIDSRLGVQINYRSGERFELVGQVVASHLDEDAIAGDSLELAFVAFRPNASWTLRVGRVNLDAFALSDHRDVGFTYDFVRPPVEFYSRMPTSLDGADLSRAWMVADTQWRAKIFAGGSTSGTGNGRLRLKPLLGLMVSRESEGLLLRISAVHAKVANTLAIVEPLIAALHDLQSLPFPQIVADAAYLESQFKAQGQYSTYFAAGALYDRNNWLLSAEVNNASVTANDISGFTTGYVSVGRRLGPVSIFGIESIARREISPLVTPDWATPLAVFGPAVALPAQGLAESATSAANVASGEQQTTSLGIRWDVNTQLALKAQWDRIHIEREGGGLWRSSTAGESSANVVSVVLDFVF